MNARNYRVSLELSPLNFPAINGLGAQSDYTRTEPPVLVKNKVVLKITKKLILIESYTNKEHVVFSMESVYEIPITQIKTKEHVYQVYTDATSSLSEAYHFAQNKVALPNISFAVPTIETFETEINGVLQLITSQN